LDDKIIVIDKETGIKCYVDEKNLLDAKGSWFWGDDDREVITPQGESKWVDEDNLIFYISKEFAQILKDKKLLRTEKEFNIDFIDRGLPGSDDVLVFVEGEDGKYYYIDSGKLDQEDISKLNLTKPLPDPEPIPFKIAQKIDIEKAEEWISHQKGKAGLYRSHPQDEALKNWSFTYDQALVAIELIKEGRQKEARELLDRILDLARHPTGLFYTAYDADTGDIREYNVHIGPNVWIAWALAHYIEKYDDRDDVYLKEIENIANNILKFQKSNFGIRRGPGLEGVSTEHMLDSYALFDYLAKKTGNESYIETRDETWTWLYIFGYDEDEGKFYRGEEDPTIATDVHSWGAAMSFLPEEINKTALLNFVEEHCKVTVNFTKEDGQVVNVTGFAFKDNQDMISVEWTAQMIIAYLKNGQIEKAEFYLTELAKLQSVKGGFLYATQFGAPTGHGWNTPSGGNSLSSTIYAKWAQEGFNPWDITIEKPFEIPEPTLLGPSIYSPELERWLSISEREHTYPLVIEDKPLELPQGLPEPSLILNSPDYSTTGIFNFTIDALDSRAKYAVVEFTNIETGHSQYLVVPLKNGKAEFDTIPGFFTLTNGRYEVKVTTYLGNPQFRVVPNPEGEGIIWNMRSSESKSCEIEVSLDINSSLNTEIIKPVETVIQNRNAARVEWSKIPADIIWAIATNGRDWRIVTLKGEATNVTFGGLSDGSWTFAVIGFKNDIYIGQRGEVAIKEVQLQFKPLKNLTIEFNPQFNTSLGAFYILPARDFIVPEVSKEDLKFIHIALVSYVDGELDWKKAQIVDVPVEKGKINSSLNYSLYFDVLKPNTTYRLEAVGLEGLYGEAAMGPIIYKDISFNYNQSLPFVKEVPQDSVNIGVGQSVTIKLNIGNSENWNKVKGLYAQIIVDGENKGWIKLTNTTEEAQKVAQTGNLTLWWIDESSGKKVLFTNFIFEGLDYSLSYPSFANLTVRYAQKENKSLPYVTGISPDYIELAVGENKTVNLNIQNQE
ncbi:MAG: hypothetical protein DRI61_12700, partial [Chloroflexi bacterium]